MIGTPAPTPVPKAPFKPAAANVMEEYLRLAAPGQGTVIYEDGYQIKGHSDEVKIADWLHRTFGGDIVLLKESKEPGDKTPDFMWKNHLWELKGVTSKNSIDRAVREAAKQIQAQPGGIILDCSASDLSLEEIVDTINDRIKRIALDSVNVMIISDETLRKILWYKK